MEISDIPKLDVSIDHSRIWDARDAGRAVARSIIKKLKHPPSFILLFSTIHYEKHGGLAELINGVWDILPKNTPLIGGTVAGFVNNKGCFSRGVTALAVSYPNLDISIGIGKHTKTNPYGAGKSCSEMINKGLKKSSFKNKLIVDMISAPTIPKVPGLDRVNVIRSNFFGWFATHFVTRLCGFFGTGLAKEVDVIDEFSIHVKEYNMIGGSAVDAGEMLTNFQFIDKKVHTNSIVALGLNIDIPIFLKGKIGVHQTDKSFDITGTACNDYIITKINNKSATSEFFNLLDIPSESSKELKQFYYKTVDYFPLTFEENNERVIGLAGIFGDHLVVSHRLPGKHAKLLSITGNEILHSIREVLDGINEDSFPFLFGFSSAIYPFMMGRKTYDIKEIFDEKLGNTPYLFLFPIVENIRYNGKDPSIRVYSTNIFSFDTKNRGETNRL